MKDFLQIVAMLPAILAVVKQAEELVPFPRQGKAKLDFVLGLIGDTVEGAVEIAGPMEKTVSRVVALANAAGMFQKGGAG